MERETKWVKQAVTSEWLEEQEDSLGRSVSERLHTKILMERGSKVRSYASILVESGKSCLACQSKGKPAAQGSKLLFLAGMPAERGRHGCRERGADGALSLGAHHSLSWLEGLISLCLCSEGSFPPPPFQKLGKLLAHAADSSSSKWLIPECFPGSPSKHRPKGRALQH